MSRGDEQPQRIVAVGDLHGMREAFFRILNATGIIDRQRNWKAENTTLVLVGDVCDRGYDSATIYRSLIHYESKAPDFNSRLIYLLGNHEVMNLFGLEYYSSSEEISSYAETPDSDGSKEFQAACSPGGWLFEWIIRCRVMQRVGPFIFAHGDLPVQLADWDWQDINKQHIEALTSSLSSLKPGMTLDMLPPYLFDESTSIFWCRQSQYSPVPGYEEALTGFLERNEAEMYICGHTPGIDGRFHHLHNGRYLCIDTAMVFQRRGLGRPSALILEQTAQDRWKAQALYLEGEQSSRENVPLP